MAADTPTKVEFTKEDADTLRLLRDKDEIRDVIARYVHGIDRRMPEIARSAYWDDAVDDHGSILVNDIDKYIAACMDVVDSCKMVYHLVGNMLIRVDGDVARSEAYLMAHHRIEGPNEPYWRVAPEIIPADMLGKWGDFFVGSRMIDRMERRNGEWRIAHRSVVYDWYRVVEGQDWKNYPYEGYEGFIYGGRGDDDPSGRLFKGHLGD
jgi:hypothetical protein